MLQALSRLSSNVRHYGERARDGVGSRSRFGWVTSRSVELVPRVRSSSDARGGFQIVSLPGTRLFR